MYLIPVQFLLGWRNALTLDCTGCDAGNDLTIEKEKDHQGWNSDQKNIHEE